MAAGGGTLKAIDSDALIESSFRRLLSSIDSERERIRGTWQQLEQERDSVTSELDRLRLDTEDWCYGEREKIDSEWKRLDKLTERMEDFWPQEQEVININCSGAYFTIPRSTLCGIEGSYLSQMFSDPFIQNVRRDAEERYYLDFNPQCFALVVEYLLNRRLRIDAPVPVVPADQQENMEMLAEVLKLRPFLKENRISLVHGTSLQVSGNKLTAMHPGWQVISAQHALPIAGPSSFEVKVLANPDLRGGMAVGVCNHIPMHSQVHSIRLPNSVMYNSNNGLIGDCIEMDDVCRGVELAEGVVIGVRHDPSTHTVNFFLNRKPIGTAVFKEGYRESMRQLFPVFGLYHPGQIIVVDFSSSLTGLEEGPGDEPSGTLVPAR